MKYKIGDILKEKVNGIELMITRIDKGDNTYYLGDNWEPEPYLDEYYELVEDAQDRANELRLMEELGKYLKKIFYRRNGRLK